jgi:uncharacterized protein YjlB
MAETPEALTTEEHLFTDDGQVPNNPHLPLIVYRAVLEPGPRAAAACEALFAGNDWSAAWVDGIYAHHHYHSTAHEVLGIAVGSVRVQLGGENGKTVELCAGDVVVIPAGVAHKSEAASLDRLSWREEPGHARTRRTRARAGAAQHCGGGTTGLRSRLRQVWAAFRTVVLGRSG